MAKPHISALIDTYNHERFIEEAIRSVLEQGLSPTEMEVLVVDDGSTDRTPEIVRQFAPRVRLLRKPNGGQASAFNFAIPEARGEIIAFLDGDDWWAKNKLAIVLEALEQHPEVGTVGHGFYEHYSHGIGNRIVVPDGTRQLHFRDLAGANLFSQLKCFLGASKVAMRRRVLEGILPIPEGLVIEADEFMFTCAVAAAGALVLDQPLFHYRYHSGNLFQFQVGDMERIRRKYTVMATLVRELPLRLAAMGIASDICEIVTDRMWVEAERMRLMLEGGKPWETHRVERAAYRTAYRSVTPAYWLYKQLVLISTLMIPPQRFYRLRTWYATKNLRRIRGVLGEPVPAEPILHREEVIEAPR